MLLLKHSVKKKDFHTGTNKLGFLFLNSNLHLRTIMRGHGPPRFLFIFVFMTHLICTVKITVV